MLAIIKKLFINETEEKTAETVIQPPAWSDMYPQYYKMLHHEFLNPCPPRPISHVKH